MRVRRLAAVAIVASFACDDGVRVRPVVPVPDSAPIDPPRFVDVASSLDLPPLGGLCIVFDDLDGDERPDMLLEAYDPASDRAFHLYINLGGGRFREQPFPYQPAGLISGTCAAGDFDGDGLLDVAIGALATLDVDVLHNLGRGSFEHAAKLSAWPGTSHLGFSVVAVSDFDRDGLLDVFAAPRGPAPDATTTSCGVTADGYACVVPEVACAPPPVVFRNAGGGTFDAALPVDDAAACGPAHSLAVAVTDWNTDGLPDVFVANDFGPDAFYVQSSPLQFRNVAPSLGLKPYNHGMGAAFADFDGDEKWDLYVTDLGSDMLYLGTDGGGVARSARDWGVAVATEYHSGWAPIADDFDADGFEDVWVTNAALVRNYDDLRSVGLQIDLDSRAQSDFLLRNTGGSHFDVVQVPQTDDARPEVFYGATAVADYDGDGRLDVLETVGTPLRLQLMHGVGGRGDWVDVRLAGRAPNRDGIGAIVTLAQAGRPAQKRIVQRTRGSLGASWAVAHFGLGDRTDVDSIAVRWPDGTMQTIEPPIAVDGIVRVVEP